jgi:hypothetical protein
MLGTECVCEQKTLEAYGLHYIRLQTSANALSVRRSLIAHGDRSDLGKVAFESGPLQNYMLVATFLERMMREGCFAPGSALDRVGGT